MLSIIGQYWHGFLVQDLLQMQDSLCKRCRPQHRYYAGSKATSSQTWLLWLAEAQANLIVAGWQRCIYMPLSSRPSDRHNQRMQAAAAILAIASMLSNMLLVFALALALISLNAQIGASPDILVGPSSG